jgi:phage FluMu gp28-like protein
MGVGLGDYLQKRFGSFAIEFIEGSQSLNEKMVYALYNAMTDKLFKMPSHDIMREDFHSIQKETSPTGKARYVAAKNKEDDSSHADFFWAAAYANFISETPSTDLTVAIPNDYNITVQHLKPWSNHDLRYARQYHHFI